MLGLDLDTEESGFANNRRAAEDTLDPADDADDVAGAGRVTGYNLGYWDSDLSRLASRSGILEVISGVDLFGTPAQASAFLERELAAYRRFSGRELEDDVVLTRAVARRVEGLGDRGWVVRATARIGGVAIHGTFAAFHVDRVLGAVTITRADEVDERARVEGFARALAGRLERAARGSLDEDAVPLVDVDPQTAPPTSELLERLALTPDDLPAGTGVFREGVLNDGSFEREFDVTDVTVGSSRLLDLQTRARLTESPEAALALLAEARRRLARPADAAEAFAAESNRELIDPRVRELGADETGAAFRVEGVLSRGDRMAAVIVLVRVDRALASVFAAGRAGRVHDRDVAALAARLRGRMSTALGVA